MILDATCSWKHDGRSKRWPEHATIRIDIRPEVRPDIVMDACSLKFPDHFFDAIYYDPPHLFRKSDNIESLKRAKKLSGRKVKNTMFVLYGYWHNRDEWLSFLDRSLKEALRCLKPDGIVYYKITESPGMKIGDLEGHGFNIVEKKTTNTKSKVGSKAKVHWLTMRPASVSI